MTQLFALDTDGHMMITTSQRRCDEFHRPDQADSGHPRGPEPDGSAVGPDYGLVSPAGCGYGSVMPAFAPT